MGVEVILVDAEVEARLLDAVVGAGLLLLLVGEVDSAAVLLLIRVEVLVNVELEVSVDAGVEARLLDAVVGVVLLLLLTGGTKRMQRRIFPVNCQTKWPFKRVLVIT